MMGDPCYDIKLIPNKGRGLVANRLIKKDDVILMEKPVVCCQFAWNGSPSYHYSACDHCLKPLDSAEKNVNFLAQLENEICLPFLECCEVKEELTVECDNCTTKYCNLECKNEAWKMYHKTICELSKEPNNQHPLRILNEAWKTMHYPPETTSIMLIIKIIAMIKQNPKLKQMFSHFCQKSDGQHQNLMHNLSKEKFDKNIETLRELTINAVDTDHIREWITPDGFKSLFTIIGINGQGIGTSSFAQWVKNVENLKLNESEKTAIDSLIDDIYQKLDDTVGEYLNNEGSGLYAEQSLINHSCSPNALINFPYSNSTLVLKATKDIQENQEICISYIDDCILFENFKYRQSYLADMYLFHCSCDKCLEDNLTNDNPESESSEDSESDQ